MLIPIKDYNPTRRTAYITIVLISLNILIFLFQSFYSPLGPREHRYFSPLNYHIYSYGMIPREITGRERILIKVPVPVEDVFGNPAGVREFILERTVNPFLTVFYSLFMHGSLLHLLGNMLFLWIFGNNIEDRLGPVIFVLFYLVCGAGASLVHLVFNWSSQVPVIGASGAVSGVMGAYLILFPRAQVKTLVFIFFFITFVDIPAAIFLVVWFVLQLINIGSASHIAWFAHIGGFLLGAFLIRRLTGKSKPGVEIIE